MITLLSPAKTLDFGSPAPSNRYTTPSFLPEAEELMETLRGYTTDELARLMKIKRDLAELNAQRNRSWDRGAHENPEESRQALFAFRGEVYRGLDADTLDEEALNYAQNYLRILSGLYGVLRPLDLIQPYRLEMGSALQTDRGDTLYQFWGEKIAQMLDQSEEPLVNLASQEYFRAVPETALSVPVITPIFREQGAKGPRVIAVYAKRQRGRMARFILDHRITDPEALKTYDLDGYAFDAGSSSESEWVFLR